MTLGELAQIKDPNIASTGIGEYINKYGATTKLRDLPQQELRVFAERVGVNRALLEAKNPSQVPANTSNKHAIKTGTSTPSTTTTLTGAAASGAVNGVIEGTVQGIVQAGIGMGLFAAILRSTGTAPQGNRMCGDSLAGRQCVE